MATAKINQKDYLRKYLGGRDDAKKKKKKKLKLGPRKVKIIDDDVDINNLRPLEDGEFDIFNSTEDAPQIAGVIDERGPVDFSDRRRWKIIADDGEGNVAISSSNERRDPEESSSKRTEKNSTRSNDDISSPRVPMKDSGDNHHDSYKKNSDVSRRDREKSSSKREEKNHARSDDDLSPPRVSIRESGQKHRESNKDFEVPRRDQEKVSSSRKEKHYTRSDDDLSPPRVPMRDSGQKYRDSDRNFDASRQDRGKLSARKSGKNHARSDDDLSPPRVPTRESGHKYRDSNRNFEVSRRDREREPSNRNYKNSTRSDDDLSPPREPMRDPGQKYRDSNRNTDVSRRNREKSSSRREEKNRTYNDDDLSPPRKSMRDSGHKYRDSQQNFEMSQPDREKSFAQRREKNHTRRDDDLSPPRLSMKDTELHRESNRNPNFSRNDRDQPSRNRKSRWADDSRRSQSPPIDKRMKKTLDGKTAGLQDAVALREETAAYKKREAEFFNKMSAEVSGEGQVAVLRDRKTGRRRNLEAEAADRREKEKRQEEIDAKYAKWGKGLKQVDDQTEKLKQDLYEMSKPLARYADDADLDAQLRAVERDGDPMREYIKQKQIREGKREPDRPNYQGSFMPNRFGIKPGHRWDGVDRSTGYEKKWFEARNAKTAIQEEAYKWSTADM